MRRDQLPANESVADLFKVSTARTRRRLARRGDAVDWQLLAEVLAAVYDLPTPDWSADPVTGLVAALLARTRPVTVAERLAADLHSATDGWQDLIAATPAPDALAPVAATAEANARMAQARDLGEQPVSPTELAEVRGVLRAVLRRYGSLTLAALAPMTDDRALKELTNLPGVDVVTACLVLLHGFGRPMLPPTPAVRQVLVRMGALPPGLSAAESLPVLRKLPAGLEVSTLYHGLNCLAGSACTAAAPNCAACPAQKLCTHGRESQRRTPDPAALTFVDLFAGAGGMSLGLTQAGLVPTLAVEVNEWACITYRANHPEVAPEKVLCGDIRQLDPAAGQALLGDRRPDLVVGGPPCQGFSLIGKRGRAASRFIDDPRNELYKEFIRWIEQLHPRLVVMENVPGLYSYAEGAIRQDIEQNLRDLGYAVGDLLVDTSRMGVPQRRQRVLFIGAAVADFGDQAEALCQRIVAELAALDLPPIPLRDAIGDLPPLKDGSGVEVTRTTGTGASAYVEDLGGRPDGLLFHHTARPLNLRDKLLYTRLRPGETGDDILQQNAHHVMVYRGDVFQDKYRRLRYDEPSPTIMSHLAKDGHMFIHPQQRRSLTVREAARIQSFPDDFLFMGTRTHQFTQVGNAVPPRLARAIGLAIQHALAEVRA